MCALVVGRLHGLLWAMAEWGKHLAGVEGLVLDISGVLYDSGGEGGGVPIPGSIEAVKK